MSAGHMCSYPDCKNPATVDQVQRGDRMETIRSNTCNEHSWWEPEMAQGGANTEAVSAEEFKGNKADVDQRNLQEREARESAERSMEIAEEG